MGARGLKAHLHLGTLHASLGPRAQPWGVSPVAGTAVWLPRMPMFRASSGRLYQLPKLSQCGRPEVQSLGVSRAALPGKPAGEAGPFLACPYFCGSP